MKSTLQQIKLDQLGLVPELKQILENAGYKYVHEIADLTINQIKAIFYPRGWDAYDLLTKVDFFYDRLFHSKVLCPALPPVSYDLGIEILEISEETLSILQQAGMNQLQDLALHDRAELLRLPDITPILALNIEFALSSFVDAYRQEDIILVDEALHDEPATAAKKDEDEPNSSLNDPYDTTPSLQDLIKVMEPDPHQSDIGSLDPNTYATLEDRLKE